MSASEQDVKSVKSALRTDVAYPVRRSIEPEDCEIELSVYELRALDAEFLVVLGKPKYTYSARGILYVPIYFVPPTKRGEAALTQTQIGVYEYEKDRAIEMLDQDGDLDIARLVPLFYPHAESLVRSHRTNVSDQLAQGLGSASAAAGEESAEEDVEPTGQEDDESSSGDETDVLHLSKSKTARYTESREPGTARNTDSSGSSSKTAEGIDAAGDVFTVRTLSVPPPTLPKETAADAERIKEEYEGSGSGPGSGPSSWLQEFMHNPYYQVHEVEDNGDCFFATVREAFRSIGHDTTVAKLRDILAKEVTYDIFKENRQLFLDLDGSKKEYDRELKNMKEGTLALKKRFKTASPEDRDAIRAELAELSKKYSEVMEYRQNTDRIMKETMGDLSNITTFDQYKTYLTTPAYWADAWAISTLEKALNVKIIIFSEGSYSEGAVHSVLNCGEVNRDLEKRGSFTPLFYIMVTYSGIHYNLVSYKNKKILTFAEIPYDVKTLVVNKCIEKNAGIYYLIDDFRQFKMELGIQPDTGAPDDLAEGADEGVEPVESGTETEGNISPVDLYDTSVVFRFFAKSEKTALPGKGAGETIPKDKMVDYKDLKTIPDWRRKLDDTWTLDEAHALRLDGHLYASVEHYYQASKFLYDGAPQANRDFAQLFTLDVGNRIGRDVAVAAAAGSKSGKYRGTQGSDEKTKTKAKETLLRPTTVKIDPQFYAGRHVQERRRALETKFTENAEMKRLLAMTKRAKLVHYVAKQPPEVDVPLMEIRFKNRA